VSRTQRFRALGLLLFLGGCFTISAFLFSLAGTNILPGAEPYRVQAIVPTAVSLAKAADVREAGVNVGRVANIGDRGDVTILELALDHDKAPIYRDARVLIRAKSVAGENYVELQRGTPKAGALPSGGVLSISHADEATQIDQLFSVFDQTRRRDLQRVIGGLSGGLRNGGADLNKTLEAAAAVPTQGSKALDVFGTERAHVAGLVDSFGAVTRALGDRRDAIRTLTVRAAAEAEAVAARDAQLKAVLSELPPFVRQAGATTARLASFSADATPVIHNLRLATQDLVPTVRDLLPAAQQGRLVMRQLNGFARAAVPAIRQLAPFSRSGSGFVAPIAGFLRQMNPFFAYLAPYWQEVSTFFALDAASFQASDATGHVARILLPISRSNLAGVLTPAQEQALKDLGSSFDTRGNNAYPAPGGSADLKPYTGTYPRLVEDPPYR
jgi:phospholipid/cholesterol/gamma-HCH transport system substrate-binding protein